MKPTKKPELLTLKKAIVPKPGYEQIEEVIASEPIANAQQFVNVENQTPSGSNAILLDRTLIII